MKRKKLVYIAAAAVFGVGGVLAAANAAAVTTPTGDLGGGSGFEVPERTRPPEPSEPPRTRPGDTRPIPPEVPTEPPPASTIPVPERTRTTEPSPTRDGRNTPPVPDRCTVYGTCITAS